MKRAPKILKDALIIKRCTGITLGVHRNYRLIK